MVKQGVRNDLKHYFKEIRSLFPVYGEREKQFLAKFMSMVDEYIATNPDSNYMQLSSVFGEPKTIVSQYIADADSEYLSKRIRTSKAIKRCILVIVLLAIISVAIFGVRNYMLYIESQKYYVDREVTEIE
jgi:hypothetical protein